jgi:hypothetical protein
VHNRAQRSTVYVHVRCRFVKRFDSSSCLLTKSHAASAEVLNAAIKQVRFSKRAKKSSSSPAHYVGICKPTISYLFANLHDATPPAAVRQSRRCLLPVQDHTSCTPLQGRLRAVFSFTHSSALRGIEAIEPSMAHHSLRHPLFRVWKLPKMASPLATGWFVLVHVRYPERRSTSHFPGVPVPAARFVFTVPKSLSNWRLIGAQNVNKVNTKATVRCALDSTWIPSWARDTIQQSVSLFRFGGEVFFVLPLADG